MMFQIAEKEDRTLDNWLEEHNKTCQFADPMNQGASGGRLTYMFTPTGLGLVIRVGCACGEVKDVTVYEDW